MAIIPDLETKLEKVISIGLDHIKATAALKEDVYAFEKSVDDKLTSFKDEVMSTVKDLIAEAKQEILGDLGSVSTDAVDEATKAVAALTTHAPTKSEVGAPKVDEVEHDGEHDGEHDDSAAPALAIPLGIAGS